MYKELISAEVIEQKIFIIRGLKVMLDKDLADLYGILTKNLNKAVTRNIGRFPEDFMFQLTKEELKNLKFQNGTSRWGGTRKLPRAFTEHGILMLSSVLNGQRAIQVNILIMRTFAKLRQILAAHKDLDARLTQLEKKFQNCEVDIKRIFDAIRALMAIEEKPKRKIGFC